MFGMPFHAITAHFAEWFRIIPLRSVNSESHERVFKDVKSTERTTNFDREHLLSNGLTHVQVRKVIENYRRSQPTPDVTVNNNINEYGSGSLHL